MTRTRFAWLAALTVSSWVQVTSRGDLVNIWLVGGQSNAPGLEQTADGRTPLADQLALKYPGQTHALVVHADGGTSLDPGFDAFGPSWHPSLLDGNNDAIDSSLFLLLDKLDTRIDEITLAGDTPQLQGMFWMQGYQDSKSSGSRPDQPAAANNYGNHLTDLIARVRLETARPGLPVVVGETQVGPNPTFGEAAYAPVVQAAQASVADADPKVWLAATDVSQLGPDDVHFSADGHYQLGTDMVALMTIPEPGMVPLLLIGSGILVRRLGGRRD